MAGGKVVSFRRTPKELAEMARAVSKRVQPGCKLCKVKFGSTKVGNDHYAGRKHKLAEAKLLKRNRDGEKDKDSEVKARNPETLPRKKHRDVAKGVVSVPFIHICHLCGVNLTSSALAKEHFEGKRHGKNLKEYRKAGNFSDLVDTGYGIGSSFRK